MERVAVVPQSMQWVPDEKGYLPALRVGDFVFCAGQVGRRADMSIVTGAAPQFEQCFSNLRTVLAAAGCTFDDVVDMTTYHLDMRDLQLFMQVKDRYFTNRVPAWTGVGVTALAMPGLIVEIKCTAVLGT